MPTCNNKWELAATQCFYLFGPSIHTELVHYHPAPFFTFCDNVVALRLWCASCERFLKCIWVLMTFGHSMGEGVCKLDSEKSTSAYTPYQIMVLMGRFLGL